MTNTDKELARMKEVLQTMVVYILDQLPNVTKTPAHDCEYSLNPERGHCDFCSDWADAIYSVYGEVTPWDNQNTK